MTGPKLHIKHSLKKASKPFIKKELIKELFKSLGNDTSVENDFALLKKKKSEIFNLIEFHRAVHAEEAAICDAASRGISIKNSIIYTTAYPCHLCTKHILASGITKVIYLHPYPKSLTPTLFKDLVVTNPHIKHIGKLVFNSFMGVAPRRFLKVFYLDPNNRKRNGGEINEWKINGSASSFLSSRTPLAYYDKELAFINNLFKNISRSKEGMKLIVDLDVKKNLKKVHKEFNKILKQKKSWAEIEAIIE
jgi:tRNA(Arg) A34 adenosine deaminase TadA